MADSLIHYHTSHTFLDKLGCIAKQTANLVLLVQHTHNIILKYIRTYLNMYVYIRIQYFLGRLSRPDIAIGNWLALATTI